MKILFATVAILGCGTFAFFYPERLPESLLVSGLVVTLTLSLAARNRIRAKGGFGLWLRLTRLHLRPALTSKAKNRKAERLGRVNARIDKMLSQRRRETEQAKQPVLRQEVRKIGAVMIRMGPYSDYAFVDFHFMDNGACFRISDDQPYPHEDIYAIHADIQDHRLFRRKVFYCVQKGQILEDKEVFPAHVLPKKFASLKKAGKVLNKELRLVIGKIASRSS